MNRRAFITMRGSMLATPLIARAQQGGKIYRLGILGNVPLSDSEGARLWGALTQGLQTLGYVEGQNLIVERPGSDIRGVPPSREEGGRDRAGAHSVPEVHRTARWDNLGQEPGGRGLGGKSP